MGSALWHHGSESGAWWSALAKPSRVDPFFTSSPGFFHSPLEPAPDPDAEHVLEKAALGKLLCDIRHIVFACIARIGCASSSHLQPVEGLEFRAFVCLSPSHEHHRLPFRSPTPTGPSIAGLHRIGRPWLQTDRRTDGQTRLSCQYKETSQRAGFGHRHREAEQCRAYRTRRRTQWHPSRISGYHSYQ